MASETCREQRTKFLLSGGKTSKATTHLSEMHHINSKKTAAEGNRKRMRESELEAIRRSPLFRNDPGRAYVLLETLRIVNNNLPFRLGEYEESIRIRDLMQKEHAQVSLNAKVIRHAVVELYDSTKREIQAMLQSNTIGSAKCFSIVADFWTASAKNTKFLGLRLYLVDSNFRFKSVLLGTRHFAPMYGERDGGIRGPFHRWIGDILHDFGISRHDLYGATSDGGSDVKWMMQSGLNLCWEWCVPHFTHAATKAAFGIVGDNARSKNPAMTDLLHRIVKTVYQTQHVEVMGTLFSELCATINSSEEEGSNVSQLLSFRIHRFLGLARVVRRVLLLWDPLAEWYESRAEKARRDNVVPPASFPLRRDKMDLVQILSLLEPIANLNQIGQAESGNQANVLLGLYKLRISLLDPAAPLKDCRSTPREKRFFRPEELSNLATTTRVLLGKAFQRAFFKRYTDTAAMNKCSFAFEMQLLLHPNFKNPDGAIKKVVMKCNMQLGATQKVAERHYAKVRRYILDATRKLMSEVDTTPSDPEVVAPPPAAVFSEDVMELFSETADEVAPPPPVETHTVMAQLRMDEEFDRWITTPTSLRAVRQGEFESVLAYWHRQSEEGTFRLLPLVARVVYSMPASSAQIERDFGMAGQMVVPHRSSLAPYNIDMSTFLNCNRDYCNITQCPKLSAETASERIPSNMMVSMERELDDDFGSLTDFFSSTSIELGLDDEEEDSLTL
ncbi:hypothetical protein BBJ28_00026501 [Nothophytophthora sp. Chile5]|nr:hypothetical protein BBJ28_00026501 [Nothophytophthora sp. Chile5]